MTKGFKIIFASTKDIFSYINDVVDLLIKIYVALFAISAISLDQNARIFQTLFVRTNKPTQILILAVLLVTTLLALYNTYKSTLFIINSRISEYNIKSTLNAHVNNNIINFRRIIPSRIEVETLVNEMFKIASRWSKDVKLSHSQLDININQGKVTREISLQFFSQRKRLTLTLSTKNFKIDKAPITPKQLHQHDSAIESHCFASSKYWRTFLVRGLEFYESEIQSREKVIVILESWYNKELSLYINPTTTPAKICYIWLIGKHAFSDRFKKIIAFTIK